MKLRKNSADMGAGRDCHARLVRLSSFIGVCVLKLKALAHRCPGSTYLLEYPIRSYQLVDAEDARLPMKPMSDCQTAQQAKAKRAKKSDTHQ
jgi:hypothetical protein